jgi:hypothetical protein
MWNVCGKIGGDAVLSERGEQYALKLPELVKQSFNVRHYFPFPNSCLRPSC